MMNDPRTSRHLPEPEAMGILTPRAAPEPFQKESCPKFLDLHDDCRSDEHAKGADEMDEFVYTLFASQIPFTPHTFVTHGTGQ